MEETFDFDPSPVMAKLDLLIDKWDTLFTTIESERGSKGLGNLEKGVKKTEQSVSAFGKIGQMSMTKLLAVAGLVTGAFFAMKSAFMAMPAVMDTFQALGNAIRYNMIGPIMQELLPILNSILVWANNNRTVFVQIGAAIANVIRFVIAIGKEFFALASKLFTGLLGQIKAVFGLESQSIGDMLRLLMTKIVAVVGFLRIMLEPVIDTLVGVFGFLLKASKAFFDGFMAAFSGVGPSLKVIADAVMDIINLIKTLSGSSNIIISVVKILGFMIGLTLRGFIDLTAMVIKGIKWIINDLSKIPYTIKYMFDGLMFGLSMLKNLLSDMGTWLNENIIQPIGDAIGWVTEKFEKFFGFIGNGYDKVKGLIGNAGVALAGGSTTVTNNNATTLRPVNTTSRTQQMTNNVNMPITLNVTGQNAEAVANQVSQKIADNTMKNINRTMNRKQEAMGY